MDAVDRQPQLTCALQMRFYWRKEGHAGGIKHPRKVAVLPGKAARGRHKMKLHPIQIDKAAAIPAGKRADDLVVAADFVVRKMFQLEIGNAAQNDMQLTAL